MTDSDLTVIVGGIASVLAGSQIWQYLQRRADAKNKKDAKENRETHLYRDDLRKKVDDLEQRLAAAQERITSLASECAALKTKVSLLEELNRSYRERLDAPTPTLQTALDAISVDGEEDF